MLRGVVLLTLLVVPGLGFANNQLLKDHPIGGVIQLLKDLSVQAKQEGETEAATYQKYTYWCKKSDRKLRREIKKEKKGVAGYADTIEGLKGDIETLGEDIAALGKQIEEQETSGAKAKEKREGETAFYKKEYTNLDETIVAVDDAIEVMEVATLVQLHSGLKHSKKKEAMLKDTRDLLTSRTIKKLQQPDTDALMKMDPGKNNPFKKKKVKVYTEHEGEVIETFVDMDEDFRHDKLDVHQREANAQNAYELAKKARDFTIQAAKDAKTEKENIKADKESELAKNTEDKSSLQSELEADELTLKDTEEKCKNNEAAWDQRSTVRAGEIEAMAMAIKILSKVSGVRDPDEHEIPKKALAETSGKVSKFADKALANSLENVAEDTGDFAAGVSFLQLSKDDTPKMKAVNLLRQAAKAAHAGSLGKLAEKIAAYDGPFDKIKQMIQKMIFRLMAEQKDEDDHKNWCDLETEKSTESKDDKQEKTNMMKIKIEEMDAEIKKATKKIVENNDKVAETEQYVEEETELRTENHAEIELTIKDAEDAQGAVANAISVLKDFYKESGMIAKEPWEFIQTGTAGVTLPDEPASWDSSYTGAADPKEGGNGVLTILEGVATKFSKMEAEAKLQDETDQQEFEKDMAAKKVSLAELATDTQSKTTKKETLQGKLDALSSQLKHTTGELDAVLQYLKDLEPACGDGDSSYMDRKKARDDEITALRKAQGILEDAFRAKAFLQH
jgi:hypothetical protein